jgi:hypothetical protein
MSSSSVGYVGHHRGDHGRHRRQRDPEPLQELLY